MRYLGVKYVDRLLGCLALTHGFACGGGAGGAGAEVDAQLPATAAASAAAAATASTPAAEAAAAASASQPARAEATVPTTLDPLPSGTPSSLEVPQPGQVNPPGGSSQAPATNPLCPDDINSGAATCQDYITAFSQRRADYCAYMATRPKDSEGDDIPFPGLNRLNFDAGVATKCCKAGVTATGPC